MCSGEGFLNTLAMRGRGGLGGQRSGRPEEGRPWEEWQGWKRIWRGTGAWGSERPGGWGAGRGRTAGKKSQEGWLSVLTWTSFKPKRSKFPVSSESPPFRLWGRFPPDWPGPVCAEAACQRLEIP